MKLLTCAYQGRELPAVLGKGGRSVIPLEALGRSFLDMNELIRETSREELEALAQTAARSDAAIPLEQVRLTAPIPHPVRDVICMGLNYQAHAEEVQNALGEDKAPRKWPIFFGKAVDRCRGDGEAVPSHAGFISTLDYECELGVVLGKEAYQKE